MKKIVKRYFNILINTNEEMKTLLKRTFEEVLKEYLLILVVAGIFTGIVGLLYSIGKATYLNMFLTVDVNFIKMINYSSGRFTSVVFFYLFAGTFLTFVGSIFIRPFTKGVKYINVLKIFFYAFAPILLFSWIPALTPGLFAWTIIIFIIGIRTFKDTNKIKKSSIEQRD